MRERAEANDGRKAREDGGMEPIERNAVRVVLLDDQDRILLQECEFPDTFSGTRHHIWITPGGGIDGDETPEEAAVRELSEELGLEEVTLQGPIWRREHTFLFEGDPYRQKETFYLVRVDSHEVSPTELLDPYVLSHRWWTLAELEGGGEVKFARGKLARYLRQLLSEGPPNTVLDVGI